ncbi:odorant receptor Or2-like [Schistocerca gregaria]|uniref:odorant receptor Or2-like n=1 Tax=Schistocerca gregaria TaxID=7010 RepID=UPI00211F3EBA|nr:odorant receptor Or2-like [Schistocerca gregaria]
MEESSLLGPSAVGVRHLGLWAAPGDTGPPGGSLRLALVVAAHLGLFSTSTANLVMDTPDDLEVLTINAFACMTTLGMIVKVVSYVVDRGSFNALLVRLAAARRAHADPGGRNAATRARRLAFGTALYRFTQVSTVFCTSLWSVAPLLGGSSGSRDFPVPIWLPLDMRATPTYQVVYLLQVFCIWAVVQGTVFLDTTFQILMLQLAAELEVLNDNVAAIYNREVGPSAVKRAEDIKIDASPQRKKDEASDRHGYIQLHTDTAEDEMYSHLVSNIKHHQTVIGCLSQLETVMSHSTLILLSSNMVCICLHIFVTAVLLQDEIQFDKTFKMMCAFAIYTYQTGLFCLIGQTIIDQSERLVNSAFSCAWPDADARFKLSLSVFMVRSARLLEIRVGKMYTLSRETFLQILNGSYRLFNLLYQTNLEN